MGFYDHPELQHDSAIAREAIYACHQKILSCIENGDAEGAYNALIKHSDLMIKDII
ncbi:MAG: hypothetical protein IKD86_02465 [Firmicutes bacterium]|nr:hypothetical protein [Bacillota bacterium]